jgi:hypothetical protein
MSATSSTRTFKPPFAELGIIARTFIAITAGLFAFAGVSCISIFTMLAYWTITNKPVDFSIAYRVAGLPSGVVVFAIALVWVVWAGIYRMQHPADLKD